MYIYIHTFLVVVLFSQSSISENIKIMIKKFTYRPSYCGTWWATNMFILWNMVDHQHVFLVVFTFCHFQFERALRFSQIKKPF